MPRWLRWTVVGLVAGGSLLRFTLCAPEAIPVKVVRAELGRVASTVSNTRAGTVKARQRAQMAPEVGGRVVEIARREGERVEAGTLLLRLNDASQRARLLLAQENLLTQQALERQSCIARDRAQRELARKRKLAERQMLSKDLLDEVESAYRAAEAACSAVAAEVGRAQAEIALAEAELEKMVLRAPFGGVVAELEAEVGEWITPSPPMLVAPPVVDLIDPTSLYVSAPMDEVDSAAIAVGQVAHVTVDSHPGQEFSGRVVRVAPYVLDVEAQNRTLEIEVELEDRVLSEQLLPGTSADVEVVLQVREPVLRIPASALLAGNRVFVVESGKLAEKPVAIGIKNWDYAEVQSGLEEKQLVVISLEQTEVRAGARAEVEEIEYRP